MNAQERKILCFYCLSEHCNSHSHIHICCVYYAHCACWLSLDCLVQPERQTSFKRNISINISWIHRPSTTLQIVWRCQRFSAQNTQERAKMAWHAHTSQRSHRKKMKYKNTWNVRNEQCKLQTHFDKWITTATATIKPYSIWFLHTGPEMIQYRCSFDHFNKEFELCRSRCICMLSSYKAAQLNDVKNSNLAQSARTTYKSHHIRFTRILWNRLDKVL